MCFVYFDKLDKYAEECAKIWPQKRPLAERLEDLCRMKTFTANFLTLFCCLHFQDCRYLLLDCFEQTAFKNMLGSLIFWQIEK